MATRTLKAITGIQRKLRSRLLMSCQAVAPVFTRCKANNSLERFAECSIRLVPNRLSNINQLFIALL